MPNNKAQRRTLSKVEMQLKKEESERKKHEREVKHREWLIRNQKRNKPQSNFHKNTDAPYIISKPRTVTNVLPTTKKIHKKIIWNCLNNSWADQSEFTEIHDKILLRIAFKQLYSS